MLLFSDPGDVVLDPFLGSGTAVAVAVAEGRVAVGSDVSVRSLRRAARRVEAALLRPPARLRCPICERTMPASRRDRDYCSDACRQRAYRKRKAS